MSTPDPATPPAPPSSSAPWLERLTSIEGLDGLLGILWKVAILYGGVWIFQYCYFGIGYTPVGLSIGDGVYWLFLSVAIGLSALVLAILGAVAMWPLLGLKGLWQNESGVKTPRPHPVAAPLALFGLVISLVALAWLAWLNFGDPQGYLADHAVALVVAGAGAFGVFAFLSHALGRQEDWGLALGLALVAMIGYLTLTLGVLTPSFGFLASVLFGGFCLVLMVKMLGVPAPEAEPEPDGKDKAIADAKAPNRALVIWVFGACIFFGPMLVNHVTETQVNFMSRQVFHRLGLSHQNVNVVLHGDAAKTVAELVEREQIQALTCQLNEDTLLVSGVDVPWTGLGARTLLAFPPVPAEVQQATPPSARIAPPRLAVDAEQASVLEDADTRCADLPTPIYFDSGSHTATDTNALLKLKDDFESARTLAGTRWMVSKLHIAAHADPMPVGAGGHNDELARKRAQEVLDRAGFQAFGYPIPYRLPELDIEAVGSRQLEKHNCGLKGPREALAECEAVNRRVQVRVLWRHAQPLR